MIEISTVNVGGWIDWGFFFSTLFGLIYATLPIVVAISVIGFALYLFYEIFLQRFPR